jgi:hypothetical protein
MTETTPKGFHAKDGWYFERDSGTNGVIITKRGAAAFGSPVVEQIQVEADTWASIVASVSREGETARTWQEALKFHDHGTHQLDLRPGCEPLGPEERATLQAYLDSK